MIGRRRVTTPEPDGQADEPHVIPGLQPGQEPTVLVSEVSKWYGDIVAVSNVTFGVAPGVTGLLGPNGAGKSTLLKMICGLQSTSAGEIRIAGQPVRGRPVVYRKLGLVSEQETIYPFLSGREFVTLNARLQKVPNIGDAVERAIDLVEMGPAAERKVGGYSKGMRQRIKVAGALVHDPDIILMDEPLNGTDPVQRVHLIRLIRDLGRSGKTVIVSSHVLEEVERFAENIIVIVNGRLAAVGDFRAIRERIDSHDREIRLRADRPRELASALIGSEAVRAVRIDEQGRILADTRDVRAFYKVVPALAQRSGVRLYEIQALDESLASVFADLVEG
ncbi:MAG TPA: ABC transporter ATP-binding protein [Thermomicrobiales bacterium]|nr:ABC transporter ATP-binding protein [Thermomicrobiales bacterium]